MDIKIALAGNPNCGKTTLFNALTGSNRFVGNWPGVTVEKKEGKLKKHDGVIITDLALIVIISLIIIKMVKNKKDGKTSCGCGNCSMKDCCRSKERK